jgi:hypothetical protein
VISGSNALSASYAISASNALNASTASFVQNAQSASYVLTAQTASFVLNAQSASYVLNAQSASFVANAQSASNAVAAQTASYANNLTVAGTLTAQTLVVQTITSSVDFVTGSTRFGSLLDNTHLFTGSVNITGSTNLAGSLKVNKIGINTGNINLDNHSSNLIVSGAIGFANSSGGTAALVDRDGSGNTTFYGGSGDIKFTDVTFTNNYLTIKNAGNVGIGTTSPNVSGQASSVNVLTVKGSTSWGGVEVCNNSNVADGLLLGFYGFTNSGITGNSAAGMPAYIGSWLSGTTGADNGAEIRFYTKGNGGVTSQKMVVANNGNVGIGATSPATMLNILYPSNIDKDTVQGIIRLTGQANTENSGDTPSAGTAIEFYNKWNGGGSNVEYSVARISGRASLGYDGGLQFDVAQNTGAGQSNFTTAMTILKTANVGIGTTNPLVTLDLGSRTDALRLTNGTTAQRPTAATGQIRYNTSFNFLEYYDGSNWVPVVGQTSPGSTASNPAESANEIKTYNPNATNGLYWIRQIGTVPLQVYCVFTDYTGAAIQGGPWTVPIISNDANSNFSTNGPTAAATFLSKCQAIGIASPGRGMENTRTTTEVYGAWLAVKRALWTNYAAFIENGNANAGAVLRMPMININGEGGASAHRLVYNTSLSTHIPPNESGDACDSNQLFCGWWGGTDISGWRTNNNTVPGPEDWGPSDSANSAYNGAGIQSVLTVCVYK